MAGNTAKFNFTVNGSQAVTQTRQITHEFDNLNIAVSNTGKVTQSVVNDLLPKVGQKFQKGSNKITKVTEGGFWGKMRNWGKWFRSLHVYGVDPLTRGLAKMGGTILGSLIHPVTLAITALMGLGLAFKKVYATVVESVQKAIARNQNLAHTSKTKLDSLQKQKSSYEQIFDSIRKINDNQKLSKLQQNLILAQVQKIKNLWGDVGVQIDKNTGKITNLAQVQSKIIKQNLNEQGKLVDTNIKAVEAELDALYTQITGKDKFLGFIPTGEMEKLFRGGFTDEEISKLKHFYEGNKRYEGLDINKLISGDTKKQMQFFADYMAVAGDKDYVDIGRKIFDKLNEKLQLQKLRRDVFDPLKVMENMAEDLDEKADEINKTLKQIASDTEKGSKDRSQAISDYQYSKLSTQGKADAELAKAEKLEERARQITKLMNKNMQQLHSSGLQMDETGEVFSDSLNKIISSNEKLLKYQEQLRTLDQNEPARRLKAREEFQKKYDWKNLQAQAQNIEWWVDQNGYKRTEEQEQIMQTYAEALDIVNRWEEIMDEQYQKNVQRIRNNIGIRLNDIQLKQYETQRQKLIEGKRLADKQKELNKELIQVSGDAVKARIKSNQLADQADREEAEAEAAAEQKLKEQQDFLDKLVNPIVERYFKQAGMSMAHRMKQLQKQFKEQYNLDKLSTEQLQFIKNLAQMEQMQDEFQKRASEKQWEIQYDNLAKKGGGYGLNIIQKNPNVIEGLQKKQVDLLNNIDQQLKVLKINLALTRYFS